MAKGGPGDVYSCSDHSRRDLSLTFTVYIYIYIFPSVDRLHHRDVTTVRATCDQENVQACVVDIKMCIWYRSRCEPIAAASTEGTERRVQRRASPKQVRCCRCRKTWGHGVESWTNWRRPHRESRQRPAERPTTSDTTQSSCLARREWGRGGWRKGRKNDNARSEGVAGGRCECTCTCLKYINQTEITYPRL